MSTYKAVVVSHLSKTFDEGIDALTIAALPSKTLKKGQVRVSVHAASLNFFDLLEMVGKYQMKPPLPFSPGAEGAGEVIEVAPDVKDFAVGDRVMCGMVVGTLAEELVLNSKQLVKVVQRLTSSLVTRGYTKKGDYVLITGAAGGMGIAAIQVAKSLGATVIACASSEVKLDLCKRMGADHVINYEKEELKPAVEKITRGHYCDVVYEIVGGKIFHQCVRCMAGMGRLLVIGFAGGEIPKLAANLALVKGFSLVGVRSGAEFAFDPVLLRETNDALNALAEKNLLHPLIVDQVSMEIEDVKKLYRTLAHRGAKGKLVVNIQSPPKSKL